MGSPAFLQVNHGHSTMYLDLRRLALPLFDILDFLEKRKFLEQRLEDVADLVGIMKCTVYKKEIEISKLDRIPRLI